MNLTILYRGPLSSCNYACSYCPFAKKTENKQEHEADRAQLERFVRRVGELSDLQISVLFTPWGEALIHKRYQNALAELTAMSHVQKVAIQTNLSCSLDWVMSCKVEKLGIWATYHPGETERKLFLANCSRLDALNVGYSVGVVGLKEHFSEIRQIRQLLSEQIYLWVNAYKREENYYSDSDVLFLESVDKHFALNNQYHASIGRACRCGASVVSIDGQGSMRRCHFIPTIIGNIYDDNFQANLKESPCTNRQCGCHIGYVHMNDLGLYEVFGEGVLERTLKRNFYEVDGFACIGARRWLRDRWCCVPLLPLGLRPRFAYVSFRGL